MKRMLLQYAIRHGSCRAWQSCRRSSHCYSTMPSTPPSSSPALSASPAPSASRSHGSPSTPAVPAIGGEADDAAARLKVLGVVGAGQMGSGIAQLGATAAMEVVMVDVSNAALERGMRHIRLSLDRLCKKGVVPADPQEVASRIRTSTTLDALSSADFVVEAVAESEELKRSLFSTLDAVTPAHAVLSSNTSSISITRIAAATKRPEQVIGMHFMNPPPIMALVEVVNGLATSQSTTRLTHALAHRMGKSVCFARDYPGFIVNRLLMPMINEAFYALLEGVGSPEDIDKGMKMGTNQPMGPLTLADFIGLDTCVAIMRVLHTGLGDAKYRPCPLLVQYVDAGWLGRKTGRGVYVYGDK